MIALLLACAPARAADPEGARNAFDSAVRGYVDARAGSGLWKLRRVRTGAPLLLRYANAEAETVHPLGGGRWRGLADFPDAAGRKRYYADVSVTMSAGAGRVTSLKWKTGAEAAALRPGFLSEPEILRANAAAGYDSSRDAKADIAAALAQARRTNRRVLLEVGTAGCVWCARMHEFVAGDKELKALKEKNFITVLVELRANGALLSDYGPVPGTPHFFVLGEDGDVIRSQDTSELEQGSSYDRDKFLEFLKDWGPSGG